MDIIAWHIGQLIASIDKAFFRLQISEKPLRPQFKILPSKMSTAEIFFR